MPLLSGIGLPDNLERLRAQVVEELTRLGVLAKGYQGVDIDAAAVKETTVDSKHYFTSFESYDDENDHKYRRIDPALEARLAPMVERAFVTLRFDASPSTAFGPDPKLPFTEVLALYGVKLQQALASLMSKHARRLPR